MTFYAFVGELPAGQKWQEAVDRYRLPLKFESDFDLGTHPGGMILCFWKGVATGMEVWLEDIAKSTEFDLDDVLVKIEPNRIKFIVVFGWGGRWQAACSAHAACVGLISGYEAAVYSPEGECFMGIDDLIAATKEIELDCAD